MTTSLEQSVKAKLVGLSKDRQTSFHELWRSLILERFLARLCISKYKDRFILKGGALLARYINLGRETKDVDFLVTQLSNTQQSICTAVDEICSIDLHDSFLFQRLHVNVLEHPHMQYEGVTVALLIKFGATKTHLHIDIGFGDVVHSVNLPFSLIATSKGPLFENQIHLHCYPKEFIFAEKIETVVFRGSRNSRMKDFHDLYSLVSIPSCLNGNETENAIRLVFQHRKTSLQDLPLQFEQDSIHLLQTQWALYQREVTLRQKTSAVPKEIDEVLLAINDWLHKNTKLCALNQFQESVSTTKG